jgi:hypothetical protein
MSTNYPFFLKKKLGIRLKDRLIRGDQLTNYSLTTHKFIITLIIITPYYPSSKQNIYVVLCLKSVLLIKNQEITVTDEPLMYSPATQ